jgi:hypothetical protein
MLGCGIFRGKFYENSGFMKIQAMKTIFASRAVFGAGLGLLLAASATTTASAAPLTSQ